MENDVIYNFNIASDQVHLVGFNGVTSFADIHLTDDANGNAVITLDSGETITLHGIDVASLTASNFVFDQTPVTENAGSMMISDGATLPLSGIIDNSGTIALNSSGDATELQIIGDGITLHGGGQIGMSDSEMNLIIGTNSASVLTNVDNTICGAGQIGSPDGTLTLVNETYGTIEANLPGGILTLDTGHTITNDGVLEAMNGGILQVDDPITGSGSAVVAGGTVAFEQDSSINVTFDNGQSSTSYGELVLGNASGFSGQIIGFGGTAPDPAHSDAIDLIGMNYGSCTFSEAQSGSADVLTVSDGSNVANLTFDNFNGALCFAPDGNGGTVITDPPAASSSVTEAVISVPDIESNNAYTESVKPDGSNYVGDVSLGSVTQSDGSASVDFGFSLSNDQINLAPGQSLTQSYSVSLVDAQNPGADVNQTVSVSIGGPGDDNFVFQPGIGAETILNFNPQQDTIELDHFANVQTVQSLITTDVHGDALINLGHNDSVTLVGVTPAELQQVAQAGHVLLH